MQLKEIPIGLVGIESNTVKAYLAVMEQNGLRPRSLILIKPPITGKALLLSRLIGLSNLKRLRKYKRAGGSKPIRIFQKCFQKTFNLEFDFFSDIRTKDYGNKFYEVYADNINDQRVIQALKLSKENVVIYGGGGIVKKPFFHLGISIIHTHPGYLPFIRGSHGVFWSLLVRKKFGATVFYMNEGIDLGEIILRKEYPTSLFPEISESAETIEKLLNFYLDPLIRAKTLIEVLMRDLNYNSLDVSQQDSSEGETYFRMQTPMRLEVAKSLLGGSNSCLKN